MGKVGVKEKGGVEEEVMSKINRGVEDLEETLYEQCDMHIVRINNDIHQYENSIQKITASKQ